MRTRSLPPQCQCTEELDISIRNAHTVTSEEWVIVLMITILTVLFTSAECHDIASYTFELLSWYVFCAKKQPAWHLVNQPLTITQMPVFRFPPASRVKLHSFIWSFAELPLEQKCSNTSKIRLSEEKLQCKHIVFAQDFLYPYGQCFVFRIQLAIYWNPMVQMNCFFLKHLFKHSFSARPPMRSLGAHTGLTMSREWLFYSFLPNLMAFSGRHQKAQYNFDVPD